MRIQLFSKPWGFTHHPIEDGEPNREHQVDAEDRRDDGENDLFRSLVAHGLIEGLDASLRIAIGETCGGL